MIAVGQEGWEREFPQAPIFFLSVEAKRRHGRALKLEEEEGGPGEFVSPALLERNTP
jgi:hypothetical protein